MRKLIYVAGLLLVSSLVWAQSSPVDDCSDRCKRIDFSQRHSCVVSA